jgi:hypothetical protein
MMDRKPRPPDPPRYTQGAVHSGSIAPAQPQQGRDIQVIVVVMAQQHDIDRRQVLEADAWDTMAPRPCELHRAGALAPDRIRDDVQFADLQQHRRVVDEGGA